MANSLTAILPILWRAVDVVSREQVGFIRACLLNSSAAAAAKDQDVSYPIVPAIAAEDVTPAMTVTAGAGQTFANGTMKITKSRRVPLPWTGEDELALSNGDEPQLMNVKRDQFAQSLRTLTNEIEVDLATEAAKIASRAYGTAGTAPFGTANDMRDFTNIIKILDDNGAPDGDRHLVIGSTAFVNFGNQPGLFNVQAAGSEDFLRRGIVADLFGLAIHKSAQIKNVTKGTNSGATTNAAGYAIGATTITLASAGTGTIVAGDVITFAGDTNKYVVVTGDADVSNGGTIVIAAPGLRVAIPASATAITTGANYAANIALSRNALHLVARAPAAPKLGKDMATDVAFIVDPRSGLTFEVRSYLGYRMSQVEVALAWGVKGTKAEHAAILLG
jgi:hypothetical protein